MESLQKILGDISPGMSTQTLLRIAELVFHLVVMRNTEKLILLFRRLDTAQRNSETPAPGVEMLLAGIKKALQDIAQIAWMEHLARTVHEDAGRRDILRTLQIAGSALSAKEICQHLLGCKNPTNCTDQSPDQTAPALSLIWAFIAPALKAFELQEVVERVQVAGQEPAYQLTNLGFDLCAQCHIG